MIKPKKLILLVIIVLIIAAAIGSIVIFIEKENEAKRLVLYGNVDIRQIELAFNGEERIIQMLVQEGDLVEAGQLVGQLDISRLKPQVDQASSQVEAQRQVVVRLLAGSRPEEIKLAQADVDAAKATLTDAEILLERTKKAYQSNAATVQELTNAQSNYDAAKANRESLQETLNLAVIGPRQEDIDNAKARLQAEEAQLRLLQQKLADAELHAPSKGIIQSRILEPGDMASPNRPVYTVALIDPLWVRAYVAESDLGKLKLGMSASVTTDSYKHKKYSGWVGYISPTAEFTPKIVQTPELRTSLVYQVRIYVHNPENELRLGMPATVTIPLDQTVSLAQTTQPHNGR